MIYKTCLCPFTCDALCNSSNVCKGRLTGRNPNVKMCTVLLLYQIVVNYGSFGPAFCDAQYGYYLMIM